MPTVSNYIREQHFLTVLLKNLTFSPLQLAGPVLPSLGRAFRSVMRINLVAEEKCPAPSCLIFYVIWITEDNFSCLCELKSSKFPVFAYL